MEGGWDRKGAVRMVFFFRSAQGVCMYLWRTDIVGREESKAKAEKLAGLY